MYTHTHTHTHTLIYIDYRQQASEFRAEPGDAAIERDLYGLPPEATVIYCNFNQQYKAQILKSTLFSACIY
jgi:hypothetical protein